MKKLILPIVTLLLTALVFNFAACQWDVGGQDVALNASTQKYNEALAKAEAAASSAIKDEEGNIVQDVYTRSSVQAMKDALPIFNTAGKTAAEIDAATVKVNEALALLVTVEDEIDRRLNEAVASLELYLRYGDEVVDPDTGGLKIGYPTTDPNNVYDETTKQHSIVYINEDFETVPEGQGNPIPVYGVSKIPYNIETNSAVFELTADSADMNLTVFIHTGVLTVFSAGFDDIKKVEFIISTNDDGTENLYDMPFTSASESGMYLAGGLIAVCAGFGEELFETEDPKSFIVNKVKNEKYPFIAGTSASAYVTFENKLENGEIDYVTKVEFSVAFSEIPVIE